MREAETHFLRTVETLERQIVDRLSDVGTTAEAIRQLLVDRLVDFANRSYEVDVRYTIPSELAASFSPTGADGPRTLSRGAFLRLGVVDQTGQTRSVSDVVSDMASGDPNGDPPEGMALQAIGRVVLDAVQPLRALLDEARPPDV